MAIKGVDLSYHNGSVDFNKLKSDGYSFVILRVGYRGYGNGQIVKDTKFSEFFTQAKTAGLNVGVYFFSQAVSKLEAVEEANWVIKQIKMLKLEYPVYIDQELSGATNNSGRADKLDKQTRTDIITAFCDTIESAGYYRGAYMSLSWLINNVYYEQLRKYDKWIARWGRLAKPTSKYGSYGLWQYSNSGKSSATSSRIDLNQAYYDYPNIMKNKGLNGYSTEQLYNITIKNINSINLLKIQELCETLNLADVSTEEL